MADSFQIIVRGEEALRKGFEDLAREIDTPRDPLSKTGRFMQMEAFANFPAEGSVFGEKWAPLEAKTIRIKEAKGFGGQPMMVRTGRLLSSFFVHLGKRFVRVYNPVVYAGMHQNIGVGRKLTRRVLLKLAKKQVDEITKIFVNWVAMTIRKSFTSTT